jgi:hypothetical protein
VADPTIEQLTESVISVGTDWGLEMSSGSDGRLRIVRRSGELLDPPVEFAVTDSELRAYFFDTSPKKPSAVWRWNRHGSGG